MMKPVYQRVIVAAAGDEIPVRDRNRADRIVVNGVVVKDRYDRSKLGNKL